MLTRVLRYSLSKQSVRFSSVALSASETEAQKTGDYTKVSRVDDWENFKMPAAPYVGMGPLPPVPTEVPTEGQTMMVFIPETYFKFLEPKLGYTGGYTLFWGLVLFGLNKEYI